MQVLVLEMHLVLEQEIVHGPEFPLRRRGLRGLGREQRVGVSVLQREVPEYETNLVGKPLQQQFRRRRRDLAAGAFEVAVFDQRHPRVLRTLEMVGGLRRHRQAHGMGW